MTGGEEIAHRRQNIERILKAYATGKLLFPRSLLEDLDQQLALGRDFVYINNLEDIPQEYSLRVPYWCLDSANSYQIDYNSLQSLTNPNPNPAALEDLLLEQTPISISYTRKGGHPICRLADVSKTFRVHRRAWNKSNTCISLKHQLSTSTFAVRINKLVCFGLGPLARQDGHNVTRSHRQHAAVKTIAQVLEAKNGSVVTCYAQDPAYDEIDKQVLKSIDITPLDDPKGFLQIDEETLVFSVNPNVPVKQIVADVQWPSAMLWNSVKSDGEERTAWEKKAFADKETWVANHDGPHKIYIGLFETFLNSLGFSECLTLTANNLFRHARPVSLPTLLTSIHKSL